MNRQISRASKVWKFSLLAAIASMLGAAALAQNAPAKTAAGVSKVDFYAGYGYFRPVNSDINNYAFPDIYNPNVTSSLTAYFNRYVGLQIEGAYFSGNSPRGAFGQCVNGACNDRDPLLYTAEAGPVVRFPFHRFVPYAHALGGGLRQNGPILQRLEWGWGVTGGVGVDYVLPYFHDHIAVRPIQADFQYSQVNHGPLILPAGITGGFAEIHAVKLSGGVVARFGVPSVERPGEMACTTQPSVVFPGEPVNVRANTLNIDPRKAVYFTWTTSGGRITPNGTTATVDTTGMAPGDYTVGGRVTYGKRAEDQTTCTAPFTVRPFERPTLQCMAVPSSVVSGTSVTIKTMGISPQNRPLTYSYASSAGQITSAGPTATLSTAGLGNMTISVTCNLVDDLGQSATGSTFVTVEAPPLPAVVQSRPLCSLRFGRDHARPTRVDNEAKGCLDDIALTLNQQADARLVVIGNWSEGESSSAGAERALNVRQYLTQEKGIDLSRIQLRTGSESGRVAHTLLVPAGASFNAAGTQAFAEGSIQRHGQAYGRGHGAAPESGHRPVVRHHRRHVAAPAAPAQ